MATIIFKAYATQYGNPLIGGSGTITIVDLSNDSVVVNGAAVSEILTLPGNYKYIFNSADNTKDYAALFDFGSGQPAGERYAPADSDSIGKIQDIYDGVAALENISVADILAGVIENSITLKQAISIIMAFASGKCDGGNSNEITFRNNADDTDRIIMTIANRYGDRSDVTIDVTDL